MKLYKREVTQLTVFADGGGGGGEGELQQVQTTAEKTGILNYSSSSQGWSLQNHPSFSRIL
jgi:hypothetical protein